MTTQSITAGPESIPATASSTGTTTKRYHPALVALHWLVAILIFSAFFLVQENEGGERFRPGQAIQQGSPPVQGFDADEAPQAGFTPREESQGITSTIGIHMFFGLAVFFLLIVRLIVRWTTRHPERASTGDKFLDWVGGLTHFGLYLLTFGMTITGIILADQRGILARTFGIGSTPAPGSFGKGGFSLGFLHGGIWTLLLLLILLHVGATLYHQFILKDNLLGRMWFGKKE